MRVCSPEIAARHWIAASNVSGQRQVEGLKSEYAQVPRVIVLGALDDVADFLHVAVINGLPAGDENVEDSFIGQLMWILDLIFFFLWGNLFPHTPCDTLYRLG